MIAVLWMVFGELFRELFGELFAELFAEWQVKETAVSPSNTRVLIAQFDPILGAGIESLLNQDCAIEWHTVWPLNESTLLRSIGLYQPDAVVIAGQTTQIDMNEMIKLTHHIPQLRFITVGLHDELIHIFDKREISLNESAEFASVVCNGRGEQHFGISASQHFSKRVSG
ncbi:MAG: hypothetical protein GY943_26070 [Chloroflexi bacterium]|nr:hypothetical protein [Chloroflexota bacterium]